jgi:hypothetical protein
MANATKKRPKVKKAKATPSEAKPAEQYTDTTPIAKIERMPPVIAGYLSGKNITRVCDLQASVKLGTPEEIYAAIETWSGIKGGPLVDMARDALMAHLGIQAVDPDPGAIPTPEPSANGDGHKPDAPPATAPVDYSSPEYLSAYDAETVRGSNDRAKECDNAESEYERAAEIAKGLKKQFELSELALRKWIKDRRDARGKPPQKGLYDDVPDRIDADGWRDLPLSEAHLTVVQIRQCEAEEIETLGELSEWLTDDGFKDMKDELEAAIQRWQRKSAKNRPKITPEIAQATPLSELWREFPLTGWKIYGLTDADVTKLAEGHVKRDNSTFPIRTVGDLNRFVTPNPAMPDFVRGYGDIKGIGQAGVDRISEAETRFWAAWDNGLKETFAAERGLTPAVEESANGNEVAEGDRGEVPVDAQSPECTCGADRTGPSAEAHAEGCPAK